MNVGKSCRKKITLWTLRSVFLRLSQGNRMQRHKSSITSFQLGIFKSVYTHSMVITTFNLS